MTTPSMTPPSSPLTASASVWVNPRSVLDRVTLLLDDTLVVANPGADVAEQIPARLAAGEPFQALLGEKVTVIPLAAISKVHSNQKGSDMDVHYNAGGKARMTNIGFADGGTHDQVFEFLQQRLGAGFRLRVQELSLLQSAIKPFLTLLAVIFFVVVGYMGALDIAAGEAYDIHGRNALLKWAYVSVVSLVGPTGMLVLGGVIVLLMFVWFARRVMNPPTQMTLTRTK